MRAERNEIHASGCWYEGVNDKTWHINYSAILTKLIQTAGRYVDQWASDLFIIWKYHIEEKLTDQDWKGDTIYFGFREQGVDHYVEGDEYNCIEQHKKDYGRYYYRSVLKLETKINGNDIEMTLT